MAATTPFLRAPYQPRPIRFAELYQVSNWRVKIYTISALRECPSQTLLASAKAHLPHWLAPAGVSPLADYQVATLIVHEGREGLYVVVSWWVDENMLRQYSYFADFTQPTCFRPLNAEGLLTCVWELAVLGFERAAWVKHVLQAAPPNLEAYLQETLEAEL